MEYLYRDDEVLIQTSNFMIVSFEREILRENAIFLTTQDEKTTFQLSKVFFEDIFIFWFQIFVFSIRSVVSEIGERYPRLVRQIRSCSAWPFYWSPFKEIEEDALFLP